MFSRGPNLEDTLFQLKFTTKQLERFAKKAEQEQVAQQSKVKKALQQKNVEGARIYAENSIRKKNEGLNYLRMAARIDAVQSRVKTAMTMKEVAKNIGHVSKELEKAMASMNLEQMDKIMSKFETQFEDLDVRSQTMDNAFSNALALSTPEDQVTSLIKQVADENGLEVMGMLSELNPAQSTLSTVTSNPEHEKQDVLNKRLASLRN